MTPRAAITLIFVANGVIWGSLLARMPAIKAHLGFTEGQLGSHLWVLTIGALLTFQMMGRIISRFGSRRITVVTGALFPWFMPLAAWSPSSVPFALALFGLGSLNGAMDVAMNAQAVEIEKGFGKRILSGVHGGWSVGSLSGAGIAALVERFSLGLAPHFLVVAGLMLGLVLVAGRALVESEGERGEEAGGFALPDRAMIPLVLSLAGGALAEGAMSEWSAIFLTRVQGTDAAVGALGFATFAASMALARILGDRITDRVGERKHLVGGFVTSILGIVLVGGALHPVATFFGLFLAGIGVSGVFPMAYRIAGRLDHLPRARVFAALATAGYGGFLIGPPLIGQTAQATSLPIAFWLVAGLLAVAAVSGVRAMS